MPDYTRRRKIGLGCVAAIQLALVVMKLAGVIGWDWKFVLIPVIIFVMVITMGVCAAVGIFLVRFFGLDD